MPTIPYFLRRVLPVLLCLAAGLRGQYIPPLPSAPAPGEIDRILRAADPDFNGWDFGINYRLRLEDRLGAGLTHAGSNFDFSSAPAGENNNRYLISRLMPRVGYSGPRISALIESRTSYSLGDNRYNSAAAGQGLTEDNGPFELQQAYVALGDLHRFPLLLKIGRQELVYGDQRLVGSFLWNNSPRTFDAAKLRLQQPNFGLDLFTGGVVYNRHDHFNAANSQDVFSGGYADFPRLVPQTVTEAYFFARNVARGIVTDNWSAVPAPARFPGPQDLYTAGFRFKSKPQAPAGWDYSLETMAQMGNRTPVYPATSVSAALAAARLAQHAWAAVAQGGYTWATNAWQPRLALIASFASGDRDPADRSSQTFQNLFPTNHQLYGIMDLSGLQNLQDYRLAWSVKPSKATSFALEAHQQDLATTRDSWYNVAGVPRSTAGAVPGSGRGFGINPSYSPDLGQELDVVGGWQPIHGLLLEGGAGHYFRGEYIKESFQAVGSKDANYAYAQITLNL